LEHIYPIFDTILKKENKEKLLKQKAKVIWMIGLSGSGKSTLARALENTLFEKGFLTKLLDGDNLRSGLNKNLGFSAEDRVENIRRAAEAANLFAQCGIVTIASFISPSHEIQHMARKIIGNDNYFEVYVNCSLEECEKRDTKGLYAKARAGEIQDFTGVNAPFEEPENPSLILHTDIESIEDSLDKMVKSILKEIKYS